MARERFAGDGEAADVGRCVAVGDAQFEETRLPEIAHQLAAFGVDVAGMRIAEMVVAPMFDPVGQRAVADFEEWPVEIADVSHQSPLNSGFFLLAKAS